jgi:hypothetical protein
VRTLADEEKKGERAEKSVGERRKVDVSEPSTSGNSHFKKQSTEEPITETGSSVVRTQGGGMKTERVTEETAVICNHC